MQWGKERRVRTRAHSPLSYPKVHGKRGHTRHRHCHGGVWENPKGEERMRRGHQFALSTVRRADLHKIQRGNPTWKTMSTCKQRQSEALFAENRQQLCIADTTDTLQLQKWGNGGKKTSKFKNSGRTGCTHTG